MKVSKSLISQIKKLPDSPGVYKFLDSKKKIIYVGKARRLKRRVASYFQPGRARDGRMELLVSEVKNIKHIKASSEAEALIYEAGLIKDLSPKFNIDLKDDKSYPFLKLTTSEEYPRLFLTRKKTGDEAIYYGPYVNVKLLKEALSFMKRVFPLRSCRNFHKKVCLEYHIGQCLGPCENKVSRKEYDAIVNELKKFLEGKKDDLLSLLQTKMNVFSASKEYEKALQVKNRIEALSAVQQLHDRSQHPMYGELDELQNALGLENMPLSIECFDISNISGQKAVGSMVKFTGGSSRKEEYRKYRIKQTFRQDDYAMICEVVRRRYSRLIADGKKLPDLVLIDGGKGHLSRVRDELDKLGLKALPAASIAKEYNHLYTASRRQPIRLSPGSRLLLLIQRIRDEAHRFAIKYHRSLRSKGTFETGLKNIAGIGPVKEKLLIGTFGTVEKIEKASLKQLEDSGIGKKSAEEVYKFFNK